MQIKKSFRLALLLISLSIVRICRAQDDLFNKNPPRLPELFGESIISTNLYERDMALSPDGNEIFYTLQSPQGIFSTLMYMRKTNSGHWSSPEVAPFSGHY